ncbi:hypothetical protein FNH22_06510 [Fulvivirga sp. M361]|uniref:hypothetical protein n=1 Tax=Fulvivirga sp. M361 TaxID=2594266 RepID=UPI00117AF077|nr:hypothetical protein [Fulvivirga sp. M361]TRX60692.1 hypothetical protein FNH22_06510 [Fulvivirga sp. M361]
MEIRKLYKETQDNKSTYKKLTQDDFENSSEGGELTAFKDSKEVRLIKAKYYGHMGQSESEYYYLNNKICFIFRKDFSYNMPPTQPDYDDNKTTLKESRYYFWGGKMIRWITPDGKYMDTKSIEFVEKSAEQLEWASELLEMVN